MSKTVKVVARYSAITAAIRASLRGDGQVVQAIVEARQDKTFNADALIAEVNAELMQRAHDGDIGGASAGVMASRVKKLATCKLSMLMDAAAVSVGLTAVYRSIVEAEKLAKGGKANKGGNKVAKPTEDKAANHDTYVAPSKFGEFMVALRGMDAAANTVGLSATDAVMLKEEIAACLAILARYAK